MGEGIIDGRDKKSIAQQAGVGFDHSCLFLFAVESEIINGMQGTMILKTVEKYIIGHQLIVPGDLVVTGVSGGPDSVVLLHMLLQLQESLGFRIHVAHLHHGLRQEADLDQSLVEDMCRDWQVPFSWRRVDVAKMARSTGMSVEEAGREVRYRFMDELCQELGGNKIATAHHRGDQAETVLLHLIQGTGAGGLQGILPQRGRIIRPLLEITQTEIMEYLNENDLPYRIDSSNYDNNYLRNRIRWELLPFLEDRFNPGMVDVLCRLAAVMKEENYYWDQQIKEAIDEVVTEGPGASLVARAEAIQKMPKAMQRRLVHHLLHQAGASRVNWDDVERVLDLMSRQGSNRRVPVSGGKWIRKSYDMLEFGVEKPTEDSFCYRLLVPGQIEIKEIGLQVTTSLLAEQPRVPDQTAVFDWERLKKPLFVRSRYPGDRFQPSGLGGSKKLSKYLIDEKIPFAERNRIGILASDEEIYWVIGYRQDERGRVSKNTRKFLEVRISNVEK